MERILTETILGLMMTEEKKLPLAARVIRWSMAALGVLTVVYGMGFVAHSIVVWFGL